VEGNYTISVYANDTQGNNRTTNSWFYVDKTAPNASAAGSTNGWMNPTPANNTITNVNVQIFNMTCNESVGSISDVWINFSNGTIYDTESGSYDVYYWFTIGLNDGSYNYTGYCNDSAGNLGATEMRVLSVDTIKPNSNMSINKTYPVENDVVNVSMNVSDETGLSACWFYNNMSGSNSTPISLTGTSDHSLCYNVTTINVSRGNNVLFIGYVNDTSGNLNSSELTITVANLAPGVIILNSPADGSTAALDPVLNVTVTDFDGDNMNVTFWNGGGEIITYGSNNGCGILTNGSVMCWGYNSDGQLGDGTTAQRNNPVLVNTSNLFISVDSGEFHTCGILTNGSLMCWGDNDVGQIGDGTITTDRLNPVMVNTSNLFTSISGSITHTCGILINGSAMCWGDNSQGQLLDRNSPTDKYSPVFANLDNTVISISAGYYYTCVVFTNGSAGCAGIGSSGTNGDGTTTARRNLTMVNTSNLFTSIAAGRIHTCGLLVNGSVMCWGDNSQGELGDGTTTNRLNPVMVNTSNVFTAISPSESASGTVMSTCGLLANGSVMCWGDNSWGQLGDGTGIDKLNPTFINSSGQFIAISTSQWATVGVLTNGSAMAWGRNVYGQLGDGTTISRNSSVQVNTANKFSSLIIGTANNTASGSSAAITWTGLRQLTNYIWKASVNDGMSTTASSVWRFTTLDMTAPVFSNNQTNASSTTYNGTTVQINLTISDNAAVDFYRLSHNDTADGSWINESFVDADGAVVYAIFNYTIENFTTSGGTLGWKVWANDTAGNVNISDVYTFVVNAMLDVINPHSNISINNTSPKINDVVNISMNVSDNAALAYCWFYNNMSGVNSSLISLSGTSDHSSCYNVTTINVSQGKVVLFIGYVNDTSGNLNYSILTITVANSAPAVPVVYYPVDGGNYSTIAYMNYSSSDADNDVITYNIYINGSLNVTTAVNLSVWNASDGSYNLTVSASDGTDSSANSSSVLFILDSTAPTISITTPLNNTIAGWNVLLQAEISDSYSVNSTIFQIRNGTIDDPVIYSGILDLLSGSVYNATFATNETWPYNNTLLNSTNLTLVVIANDTLGNKANDSTYFVLDNSKPGIQYVAPLATGSFYNSNFSLNVYLSNHKLNYSFVNISLDGVTAYY
ncbi:MAG: hypothetical protein KKF39_07235, partial [Nanoarchaeota archaeon]|nr:hypothetical protein [Nanoarchaeota archaeon]